MLILFIHIVDFAVISDFFHGNIDSTTILYLGDIILLSIALMSSAYIVYKTTDAAVSFYAGFAYLYRLTEVDII